LGARLTRVMRPSSSFRIAVSEGIPIGANLDAPEKRRVRSIADRIGPVRRPPERYSGKPPGAQARAGHSPCRSCGKYRPPLHQMPILHFYASFEMVRSFSRYKSKIPSPSPGERLSALAYRTLRIFHDVAAEGAAHTFHNSAITAILVRSSPYTSRHGDGRGPSNEQNGTLLERYSTQARVFV
jgi:hypothetical protein